MQVPALDPNRYSQLLLSLDELAQRQRTARKILVCSYTAEGRELLRGLALAGRGWIGFEPTDPRRLANELVAHDIVRDGMRVADAFDLLALLDQAIDETVTRTGAGLPCEMRALAEQMGFRRAIRRSIEALRLEGIDSPALRCAHLDDLRKRNFLADIYGAYELKLRQSRFADTAEISRRAAHGIARGTISLPRAIIVLTPGIPIHGVAGRFIDALRSRGALLLQDDAADAEPPRFNLPASSITAVLPVTRAIDIFAASSPLHEIKEVLRRCVAAGLHWDEVEIIATDANAYGCALDSIARRLNIAVSYAIGLPANRTRPGRVVAAYLRWIQEDFSDEVMRALLESGDIVPDGEYKHAKGVSLARTLRKLRIGWGRARYLDHIAAAEREALIERGDDEGDDDEQQLRRAAWLDDLAALRALFAPVLAATPPIPDRLRRNASRLTPSALAGGLAALLEFAVTDHDVDRIAAERIHAKIERIRATMTRELSFESVTAVLRERLDIRVPAVGATGPAPWASSPGHIHFSNIEHGGYTGRRATFMVGLDAGRFPRASVRDPLLTDDDRLLVSRSLITTGERVAEAQFRFATLFARLRGEVTLSYSAYDTLEGRKLGPAAVVLDAHRLRTGERGANYEQLRQATSATATAVARANAVLDGDDVWLSAMSSGGVMRAAQHVVRNAFNGLDRGLAARALRNARVPGPHHGLVGAHPVLDPRVSGDVVSPSRLESLGTCGLRYFYRYVLGIRPPDIPAFDPEVWLDPRNRGSLLHEVFESTLRTARAQDVEALSSEFEALVLRILETTCVKWRGLVPPPSDAVYAREIVELRADAAAFANMCRQDGANWQELELSFGLDGKPAVALDLRGAQLKLQGRIDRVDELEDGRLLVIDYKTGSAARYGAVAFDGGRRLQHFLYCSAVEQLLSRRVARMEYRFPTARADGIAVPFEVAALAAGRELVDALLDNVAAGRFLPTDDRFDCSYCDFRTCCRVTTTRSDTISPLAAWARNLAPILDEYRPIVELKGRFK
ncbi:MAG: PD-(D/E)XK nuclease family protein [Gemmatimonadota bacterium]